MDVDGRFRWINAGAPGACGDSGLWKWSRLGILIDADKNRAVEDRRILASGKFLLGDSAFAEDALSMRTPYNNPTTRAERFYNYLHSSARFRVEHVFGRLKWKFTALKDGLFFSLDAIPSIIEACVVLYNFILHHEGASHDEEERVRPPQPASTGRRHGQVAPTAGSARVDLTKFLADNFLLQEWGLPGSRADRARRALERRQRRGR